MESIKRIISGKRLSGVTIVEMAYIIPFCLFLFVMIIYTVFYYHDKIVISGALAETAAVGAEYERRVTDWEYDAEIFLKERLEGKLILMTDYTVSYGKDWNTVSVQVLAQKGSMKLKLCQRAVIAKPEEYVRWIY